MFTASVSLQGAVEFSSLMNYRYMNLAERERRGVQGGNENVNSMGIYSLSHSKNRNHIARRKEEEGIR